MAAWTTAPDCIFCKIVAGQIPSKRVMIGDDSLEKELFAFDDVNPQAPHHVLVVPREHIPSVNELKPEQAALAGRMLLAGKAIAAGRGVALSGYRLVLNTNRGAGQTVFHIHLHVLGGRSLSWPPG